MVQRAKDKSTNNLISHIPYQEFENFTITTGRNLVKEISRVNQDIAEKFSNQVINVENQDDSCENDKIEPIVRLVFQKKFLIKKFHQKRNLPTATTRDYYLPESTCICRFHFSHFFK